MKTRKFIFSIALFVLIFSVSSIASEFKLPKYEKFKLKNGLTVYLMEQSEVPLINVNIALQAGAIYDDSKNGLASLVASSLVFGTKNFTKNEIESKFDFVGANLATYATKETARISASFAKKDQKELFKIIYEVLSSPKFEASEFEKEKSLVLSRLEQAKESPKSVIGNYFDEFIFGNSVYSYPVSGKPSIVKDITVEDMKKFYTQYYTSDNSVIAIVGDFNAKEMKKEITSLFSNWKTEKSANTKLNFDIKNFDKNRVLLINKDDATETNFYIGSLGIKRSNPDFVAVQVINTILGGRFTSWLNDELRVNSGLTYGANSSFSTFKNSGSFRVTSFTRNENTVKAIDLALDVLNRLHEKGLDENLLTSAKNYINGQYPPRYETSGSLSELLVDMYINDFDEAFINNFQKNVNGLTLEKSKEIIKNYFPNKNMQFVIVGKAAEIKDQVAKYGEVTLREIKE